MQPARLKTIAFGASLLCAICFCAGCGRGRVADFASKADDLVAEYKKRVDAQIAESTTYYHNAATLAAGQAERVGIETLQEEREERATQLEADYREGRKPVSLYRNDLRAYAEIDFAALKLRLTSDEDASAPYLAQLVALESDAAIVDGYDKILKNLVKERSIKDQIGDLQQFVSDSKTAFDKLVCDGLDKQLNAQPPPAKDKIASLQSLKKKQNCSTKK